jgi:hypothetical protein
MPSPSEFDADGYCRDVLGPARKRGNIPPPDLIVRYAIATEMERDELAFGARVEQVVKYWRSIKQQKRYRKLADALLAAHAELRGADKITFAHFMRRRREERDQAQAILESQVKAIAANTSAVMRSTLTWLYHDLGGVLSEEMIEREFATRQLAVIDQEWTLPRRPPGPYSDLATHLSTLGFRLAAEAAFGTEAVRGGFRLRSGFELPSGDRITRELLDQKNKSLAQRPHDERNTALGSVLTMLRTAADRPGELDALLIWQLIDVVQPRLVAGLPNRSVADDAAKLGLDQREAAELVLALTQRRSEATGSRVAALVREADAAQQAGATEEAAALLTAALATASDPNDLLQSRLRSIAPPPPVRVLATPTDGSVRLEWMPGPARTSGIFYRAVRNTGGAAGAPAAGLLLAETPELYTTDHEPIFGERLYYTVFASRGADVWSAGTSSDEVLMRPEVADCDLEAHDSSVLGSWRVAPGTVDVVVTRAEGSSELSPADMRPIPASLAGFRDLEVQSGTRYYYRIRAVYVSGVGERWITQGIGMWATPEAPLGVVRELRAELLPGAELEVMLSWQTVATGAITIHRSDRTPPWPPGTPVGLAELASYGRPVPGEAASGSEGEGQLRVQPPNGRSYFCAITVGASQAMVGSAVPVSVIRPVTDLRASRRGGKLRLDWRWADDCHVCQVQWRTQEDPPRITPPVECGLRRFEDDGGFELDIGPQPGIASVRSVHRDSAGEIVSSPVEIPVPGRDVRIGYAFRRKTRWTPWRHNRLVLTADQAVRVPPLVVVHSIGRVMPLRAEQGTPIFRWPGADVSPNTSLSVRISAPPRGGPDWLTCFFDGDPGEGMSLVRAGNRS